MGSEMCIRDSNDGAGAAGAVVGALLGREHAKKNSGGQKIIGYRQQEVCNIRTVMMEQTVEEITGYRLRVEVDGKIISLESQNPRAVGERIEINRRTTYSLRGRGPTGQHDCHASVMQCDLFPLFSRVEWRPHSSASRRAKS